MLRTHSPRHCSAYTLHLEKNYENQLMCSCPFQENHLILHLKCGFQRGLFPYKLNEGQGTNISRGRTLFLAGY